MSEIEHIHIDVCVVGAYQTNTYLVYRPERDDMIVIDPGDDRRAIVEAVRANGRRLTDIVLTHGHFDHIVCAPALKALTGARIHARTEEAEYFRNAAFSCGTEQTQTPFEPFEIDAPLTDHVVLAGVSFQVIPTPGHTLGGASLYQPDQDVLFSGDTLFAHGFGRTDLYGGNMTALYHSLKTLLEMPEHTEVYPGHGPHARMGEIRRLYRR